jgi:hypothetical protein
MNELKIDTSDLYETRLILLLETYPQSNKYNRVVLSKEEFKNISLQLGKTVYDGDIQSVNIELYDVEYELPESIRSI